MFPSAFIMSMKDRLTEDKAKLENELETLATPDPDQPGRFIAKYRDSGGDSEEDNSGEITEYADDISLIKRLETELRDTIKALQSIEKGTYGVCKYCHKDIDQKRLEARPTSSACISCKKVLTQEI